VVSTAGGRVHDAVQATWARLIAVRGQEARVAARGAYGFTERLPSSSIATLLSDQKGSGAVV
jgi:hypothetical protein